DGVTIIGHDGSAWNLSLIAVGDAAPIRAAPVARGNRVEYRRSAFTEWYVNGPLGLEQGVTLAAPPSVDGALTVTFAVHGAAATPDGDNARIHLPNGGTLRYGGLAAADATGRALPTTLSADGDTLRIAVDDRGAAYPVTIDPLVQQVQLLPADIATTAQFGYAVAVSDDGTTALVGATPPAPGQSNNVTVVAYVFVRNGTTWTQQQRLTNGSFTLNPLEGDAEIHAWVALSRDGNTALLYHPASPAVYVRTGGVWSLQQQLPSGAGTLELKTVALSGDGNTAFIASGTQTGYAVFVYVRTGTTWAQQGTPLAPNGVRGQDRFGTRLGLAASTDGNTAVVGAPADAANKGAAYVFIRDPATQAWSQRTKLTASDGVAGDYFGTSVAVSADGNTALIGAYGSANFKGAAYFYVHGAGTTYAEQKIPGSGPCDSSPSGHADQCSFGTTVALSGDASTAMIGLQGKFTQSLGAVFRYRRGGAIYQQLEVISGQNPGDEMGRSGLAANGDGTTILVGTPLTVISGHTGGAVYVYVPQIPNPIPPSQPPGISGGSPAPLPIARPAGPGGGVPAPLPNPRP
ncbi:MAG TPA: hypothetical protein VIC60_02305, partial [Thermomicrobiales bacterium]